MSITTHNGKINHVEVKTNRGYRNEDQQRKDEAIELGLGYYDEITTDALGRSTTQDVINSEINVTVDPSSGSVGGMVWNNDQ